MQAQTAANSLFTPENIAWAMNGAHYCYTVAKEGPLKGIERAKVFLAPYYEKLKKNDETAHHIMLAVLGGGLVWAGGLWSEGAFIITGVIATRLYSHEICISLNDPATRERFAKIWSETKSIPVMTYIAGTAAVYLFPMPIAGMAYGSYLAFPPDAIIKAKKEEKSWLSNPLYWDWFSRNKKTN